MPVTINGDGAITGLVITTADLANSSVTTAKIADVNVTTAKIADSAITTGKIADGAVATADIAANAVTVAKMAREGTTGQVLTSNGAGSDPSYQTISTTPTTAQVLSATAGASAGAVGTYAFGRAGSNIGFGGTLAGSSIQPTAAPWASSSGVNSWSFPTGGALSGTWRAMGTQTAVISGGCGNYQGATLWLRIS